MKCMAISISPCRHCSLREVGDVRTRFRFDLQLFADGDKTEEPTAKKRQDARKKGQVARSTELSTAFVLLVGFFVLKVMAEYIYTQLADYTTYVFSHLDQSIDTANVMHIFAGILVILVKTALPVMLAIMCLCMYFIMRAGLMSRVKEVGIYRAIGVTKGNLIFRFLIEALVLCAVTVLTGFLAMSLLMRHWVTHSALMKILFHYPLWMMLLLFLLLVFLCAFCGVLPVMLLLRKTPSEILAKYDI